MDANERGRKRRETAAPELDSVPPPRRRKVLNPLDPEVMWDKETSDEDSEELEAEEEEGFDAEEQDAEFDNSGEDLDDWDHPIRRLKIN